MSASERVTVTLPAEQANRLRNLVDAGKAKSVSGYVSDVLARHLDADETFAWVEKTFGRKPSEEALADARRSFGVEEPNPKTYGTNQRHAA